MRIQSGIVVVACGGALWCGIAAWGQNREKTAEPAKKGADAGKRAAPDAKQAPVDSGKKASDSGKVSTGKPGTGKPGTGKPGETPAAEDADEQALRASAETFTKLYNAHGAKGLAALFAPKAEMIDEDDQVVKGRDAIEKEFASVFKQHPKAAMQVDVDSVRVLTPNLAIEEGLARSKDSPDGPEDVTVYVAIHVKVDGKWLLACVRDWDAPSGKLSPHDHLLELDWLVGEWIEESPDSVVHTKCEWHDNGNFLMQEFKVHIGGENANAGTERI